jgi:PAS domain S-box-containing protein
LLSGSKTASGYAQRPGLRRHGFATVSVLAAALITLGLTPLLHGKAPLFPFVVAVILAAWYGGWVAGLVSTALSIAVVQVFFFSSVFSFFNIPPGFALLASFGLLGVGISVAIEYLWQAANKLVEANDRLELANRRLASAQEAGRVGTWEWNPESDSAVCSEVWFGLHGIPYPPGGALSTADWEKSIHAEDRDRFRASLTEVLRGGGEYDSQFRIVWPDGAARWIRVRGQVSRKNGKPLLTGAAHDITERQEYERKLRDSEARLDLAQKAAGCGVWDANILTGETYWSEAYYSLYGLDSGVRPCHENWLASILPEDRARAEKEYRDCIRERRELNAEFRIVRDREVRWIATRGQPVLDPRGQPERLIGIHLDITERKRIDEELRARNDAVVHSNEELQRFAYAVSHDLQTPLRNVNSFVELLARRNESLFDSDSKEFIQFITGGVDRMNRMIRGLLDYSRVDHAADNPVVTDATVILELALQHLKRDIDESGAEVTFDPLPTVRANDVRLLQVFQNIVGNALKYRTNGRPRIHVTAVRQGDEWRFSVRDNGIGIDMKHADRIFGVFQRLHGPNEYEGTGIGLAICKRIVERHGGRIWVESEPDKGSTFCFTLPAEEA